LAYMAAGFKRGDEVITTPNTFAATSNMLLATGAKPIFCDINMDTYNIDVDKIEKLINKNTKAVVPVHFAGYPCEMNKIFKIAKKYKLIVIEDACHALGAYYHRTKIGSCKYSDMTVFSFHPVKSITTGEGGAVLTNNKDYYKKLILLRNHGAYKNNDNRNIMIDLGYNYRLTDIQATLGISQLKKIDRFISMRKKIASTYTKAFKKYANFIILPKTDTGIISSAWHLYVINLKDNLAGKHLKIFNRLISAGIGVQVHYMPVYFHPYYVLRGYKRGLCPKAEKYYQRALSLPVYPYLKSSDQKYVIKQIVKLFNQ